MVAMMELRLLSAVELCREEDDEEDEEEAEEDET